MGSLIGGAGAYAIAGLAAYIIWSRAFGGSAVSTFVLQEWSENHNASDDLVVVRGRQAGVWAFILDAIGVDPSVRLILRPSEVELSLSGMTGRKFRRIPTNRVASTETGYSRPVHWLVLGVVSILFAILSDTDDKGIRLAAALAAAVLFAAYYFGRAAFISVETSGGHYLRVRYKGSVIHGRVVSLEAAQRFCRLLGDLSLADGNVGAGPSNPSAYAPPIAEPEIVPEVRAYCGACGTAGIAGRRCASCGALVE